MNSDTHQHPPIDLKVWDDKLSASENLSKYGYEKEEIALILETARLTIPRGKK